MAKLRKCYGSRPEPSGEGKSTFRGKFSVETPQDLGGAGRLERIDTSLGTLWIYVERFRGNDDLESELAKRREAVDTFVDLTLGWLRKEFGEEANFQQLEDFVGKTVRADLKNLAVYLWVEGARGEENSLENGFLERLWLFGRERDYLTVHDMAVIVRAHETNDPGPALEILARFVARELEADPQGETLAVFRDVDRLVSSWKEHVRGSKYYAQYVRKKKGEVKAADDDALPDPGDAMVELLLEAFLPAILSSDAALEVTLDTEVMPVSTNGTWNETEKTVTWKGDVQDRSTLPTVCSATWAVPNAPEQRKRFGQLLLAGQDLADYAIWYESLSEDEAAQWLKALATCRAGDPWQKTVKSFLFDEKTAAKESLAGAVKSLLIEDDDDDEEEEEHE